MHAIQLPVLKRVMTLLVCVLIVKVNISVLSNYGDYFPANFDSMFLQGRESYFFGGYHWAFYAHILSGPVALILGTLLLSQRFLKAFPKWHRRLGRIQGMNVLFVVAPSGLVMARHAATGETAGAGFAALAIGTAVCMAMGWRSAIQRRFIEHRRWMQRSFLMLCSAVVLRLTAGFTIVTNMEADWVYPASAWTSWLIPLAIFELIQWITRLNLRRRLCAA